MGPWVVGRCRGPVVLERAAVTAQGLGQLEKTGAERTLSQPSCWLTVICVLRTILEARVLFRRAPCRRNQQRLGHPASGCTAAGH